MAKIPQNPDVPEHEQSDASSTPPDLARARVRMARDLEKDVAQQDQSIRQDLEKPRNRPQRPEGRYAQ